MINASADTQAAGANTVLPEGANIFSRKVARSGHISYEGRLISSVRRSLDVTFAWWSWLIV